MSKGRPSRKFDPDAAETRYLDEPLQDKDTPKYGLFFTERRRILQLWIVRNWGIMNLNQALAPLSRFLVSNYFLETLTEQYTAPIFDAARPLQNKNETATIANVAKIQDTNLIDPRFLPLLEMNNTKGLVTFLVLSCSTYLAAEQYITKSNASEISMAVASLTTNIAYSLSRIVLSALWDERTPWYRLQDGSLLITDSGRQAKKSATVLFQQEAARMVTCVQRLETINLYRTLLKSATLKRPLDQEFFRYIYEYQFHAYSVRIQITMQRLHQCWRLEKFLKDGKFAHQFHRPMIWNAIHQHLGKNDKSFTPAHHFSHVGMKTIVEKYASMFPQS